MTWAPPDKRPLRISMPIEPLPAPVISAFLSLNVVPDVAISCRTSKYTPIRLVLYSHTPPWMGQTGSWGVEKWWCELVASVTA